MTEVDPLISGVIANIPNFIGFAWLALSVERHRKDLMNIVNKCLDEALEDRHET